MKKHISLLFTFLISTFSIFAASPFRITGKSIKQFSIVYNHEAEPEEGSLMAASIQGMISEASGITLPIQDDLAFRKGNAIILAHPKGMHPFQYSIAVEKGRVTINAGGCWAMQYAARQFINQAAGKNVSLHYKLEGNILGNVLFERPEGVNFRILDDNIWDYSVEKIPKSWQEAGLDCRDDWRAPQFAQIVRSYMPDVVMLQEYSRHMHDRFYPIIEKYGYKIAWESGEHWNNTPLFYDSCRMEMIESNYVLFTPQTWSNGNTKSFTSAVFLHRETGDTVACIGTHLWWQGDKMKAGSTMARAAQIRLIMAEAEVIRSKYNCTIFLAGDMNCEEATIPIQQLLDAGYVPCYKDAVQYADHQNGHHVCSPASVGIRKSDRKGPGREVGAIDHCFIYNPQKGAKVQVFDCLTPYFTVLLTDHYPNLIDVKL